MRFDLRYEQQGFESRQSMVEADLIENNLVLVTVLGVIFLKTHEQPLFGPPGFPPALGGLAD